MDQVITSVNRYKKKNSQNCLPLTVTHININNWILQISIINIYVSIIKWSLKRVINKHDGSSIPSLRPLFLNKNPWRQEQRLWPLGTNKAVFSLLLTLLLKLTCIKSFTIVLIFVICMNLILEMLYKKWPARQKLASMRGVVTREKLVLYQIYSFISLEASNICVNIVVQIKRTAFKHQIY